MNVSLSAGQQAAYNKDGYIVLRSIFSNDDLARLDGTIDNHLPANAYAPGKTYPEPAKYTLSAQCPADPGLAYIAEHPKVVCPVEQLLGGPGYLTAYVVYVRTSQDAGSVMHNDYKRWRPVGSSMNWLFTIVPLTDFDQSTGPLLVAPGSHQPHLVEDRNERTLHRGAPEQPPQSQFVDAQLRRATSTQP
jgi:ectoine hydroxylase